jgi:hypothetical protein
MRTVICSLLTLVLTGCGDESARTDKTNVGKTVDDRKEEPDSSPKQRRNGPYVEVDKSGRIWIKDDQPHKGNRKLGREEEDRLRLERLEAEFLSLPKATRDAIQQVSGEIQMMRSIKLSQEDEEIFDKYCYLMPMYRVVVPRLVYYADQAGGKELVKLLELDEEEAIGFKVQYGKERAGDKQTIKSIPEQIAKEVWINYPKIKTSL